MQRGAHVTVLNRTHEKAMALSAQLNSRAESWDRFPEVVKEGYDILVNCTPDGAMIAEEWILPQSVVMDVVYVPRMTTLLERASQKGCQIVFGEEMFEGQALEQQRIWL